MLLDFQCDMTVNVTRLWGLNINMQLMRPVRQGIKISLWFVVNNVFSFFLVFRHNYVNMTVQITENDLPPDFFFSHHLR